MPKPYGRKMDDNGVTAFTQAQQHSACVEDRD